MTERTNKDRQNSGLVAILTHGPQSTGHAGPHTDDELHMMAIDTLADMMHWAHSQGLQIAGLYGVANQHFKAEENEGK